MHDTGRHGRDVNSGESESRGGREEEEEEDEDEDEGKREGRRSLWPFFNLSREGLSP